MLYYCGYPFSLAGYAKESTRIHQLSKQPCKKRALCFSRCLCLGYMAGRPHFHDSKKRLSFHGINYLLLRHLPGGWFSPYKKASPPKAGLPFRKRRPVNSRPLLFSMFLYSVFARTRQKILLPAKAEIPSLSLPSLPHPEKTAGA